MFRPSLFLVLSDILNTFELLNLFLINEMFLEVLLLLGSNCSRIEFMPSYRMLACMSSFEEQTISDPFAPIINSVNASPLQVSDLVFFLAIRRIALLNLSLPVSAHLKE